MADFDVLVIGAGAVGLAIGRELAIKGRSVLIVERADAFGSGISSRNSEVIHAGLYYPQGSLKARACVRGRELLYEFCRAAGVPHRRCGKIIVAASPDRLDDLSALARQAADNGVSDLRWLDPGDFKGMEPDLAGAAALLSPATGIFDSHSYMQALLGAAEAHGVQLVLATEISRIERRGAEWSIWLEEAGEPVASVRAIVDAGGLEAAEVARLIDGYPAAAVPTIHYARGAYFGYDGAVPFRHLIYPLPEPGGLGIHLTLDMAGRARFGPDVEWIDEIDFAVDPGRANSFAEAIRRYWPGLDPHRLVPALSLIHI